MPSAWRSPRSVLLTAVVVMVLIIAGVIAYLSGGAAGGTAKTGSKTRGSSSSAATFAASAISPTRQAIIVDKGAVTAVALSSDHTTLADRLADGVIELRATSTGAVLSILKTAQAKQYDPGDTSLAFSPDGKTLAVGLGAAYAATANSVELWNPATHTLTATVPLTGYGVRDMAYSPDGSSLAIVTGHQLVLLDTKTLSPIYIPSDTTDTPFQGSAWYVAYSGDGGTIAVANNDGDVRLWDVRSTRFTKSLAITSLPGAASTAGFNAGQSASEIAVNGDGSGVAVVGNYQNGQNAALAAIWLWNPATGKTSVLSPADATASNSETAITYDPAGKLFASADGVGGWQLWNSATGTNLANRYAQSSAVTNSIAFSPDGQTFATAQTSATSFNTTEQAAANSQSVIELWYIHPISTTTRTCAASPRHSTTSPVLAYTTSMTVQIRCGTGKSTTLAFGLISADNPGRPAWSWDGSQLAWTTGTRVNVAETATGAVRTWFCNACAGAAFLRDHMVTVAQSAAGGQLSTAVPQLLQFPVTGFGDPSTLTLSGVATAASDTDFSVLSAIGPKAVVVAFGSAGGSDLGGNQLLYHVDEAGKATEYGSATMASLPTSPGVIFGELGDIATAPSGGTLALTESTRGGICGGESTAVLLNTATGAITVPSVPTLGAGIGGFWVEGLWFDTSGTPYASFIPNESTCNSTSAAPTNSPTPLSATPIVCKLVGGSWVATGSGTFQASYGPAGWVAQERGVIANSVVSATVQISQNGAAPTPLVSGVASFAWAPVR